MIRAGRDAPTSLILLIPLAFSLALAAAPPAQAAALSGPVVVAGGGSEGDVGDTAAWSYRAYRALLEVGDVSGDGEVTVVILSTAVETDWLPSYFQWLGADRAFNLRVSSRSAADDPAEVDAVRSADVVFIKGGDQGAYYDAWNDTRLEEDLRFLVEVRGGAIGGTSAGAMSQSQYAFAGGKDLISLDVLEDATTSYLDDADGGSGIHDDFLGFVAGALIDTHYTSRARLGRLLGLHARAMEDERDPSILAIGIEERTALIIRGDEAEVVGDGSVDFITASPGTIIRRERRRPLIYTDARLDRLVDGWRYDLGAREVSAIPAGAQAVSWQGHDEADRGSLSIQGDDPAEIRDLARSVTVAPLPYSVVEGGQEPFIHQAVGILDAQDSDTRGSAQESLFRALYDNPGDLGLLITDSARLSRAAGTPEQLEVRWNAASGYRRAASIFVDGKGLRYKQLAPVPAPTDTGSRTLRAAALVGLKVHVLADAALGEPVYDSQARQIVR